MEVHHYPHLMALKKCSTGFALGLLIFLNLISPGKCFAQAGRCIIVSDIHLNPFYSNDGNYTPDTLLMKKLSAMPVEQWDACLKTYNRNLKLNAHIRDGRKDSNYTLLMMAIDSMHARLPNPAFILIAGDFVWHGAKKKDSLLKEKDIQFIAWAFRSRFGTTIPIIPALGNNDSNDHNEMPKSGFLDAFAKGWVPNNKQMDASRTFKRYGYYAYRFTKLKVIVLNSALVYSAAKNNYDTGADGMFGWLKAELANTKKNVWIMWHVPPGKNAFDGSDFWNNDYANFFYNTIVDNHSKIKFCIASHTHFNEYKAVCDSSGKALVYIHLVPSIGMDHGNNPSFEIADFDAGYNIKKETSFYLDLDNTMHFKKLKRPNGLDSSTPATLLSYLQRYAANNAPVPADYSAFYNINTHASILSYKYFQYDILKGSKVATGSK